MPCMWGRLPLVSQASASHCRPVLATRRKYQWKKEKAGDDAGADRGPRTRGGMGMTYMMAGEGLLLPDGGATVRELSTGDVTLRDGASSAQTSSQGPLEFRGYRMKRQMPSTSTEADIYIVEREGALYVLKLYRYGIEPKDDILLRMKDLSQAYPRQFIRVFDVGFDAGRRRWYEVQEHAQHGTLQAMMDERAAFPDSDRDTFFNEVAREVGEALHILHQNGLLHLDIKPSNILLRSAVPLDLVLIDFGISTSLSSDMSKKFTQTRGTPMYQSPESWSGGMGRASDWWGLGMILLEIATRAHPFKGLAQNVIACAIATRPIDVPPSLEEGRKELLQGLLTRDPAKRWNWDQVSRWLEGERGIPLWFEEEPPTSEPQGAAVDLVRPFAFMGRHCRSLAELADAFAQDEEAWAKGRALLMHGSVRAWLEQNGDFERGEELDVSLTRAQSPDERMFLFVLRYGDGMRLAFGGHPLTAQGLLHVAGKALRREPLTDMEQKILEVAADGRLLTCMDLALTPERASVQTMGLRSVLARLVGRAPSDMAILLDLFLRPQAYWSPFLDGALGPEDAAAASEGLTVLPVPIERWTQMS
ncbi:MAG: protein kinase, partial [Synergistaceae bacterium]|nr:protein kinase [Synergistaceae bacterium]